MKEVTFEEARYLERELGDMSEIVMVKETSTEVIYDLICTRSGKTRIRHTYRIDPYSGAVVGATYRANKEVM